MTAKKVDCIFEELPILLLIDFLVPSWENYLNRTTDWGGHNTANIQASLDILSSGCGNTRDFLDWRYLHLQLYFLLLELVQLQTLKAYKQASSFL